MLSSRPLALPLLLATAAICASAGCAIDEQASEGAGLDDLIDAPDGKTDGVDPVAALYHGRARMSEAGIVRVVPGQKYEQTLTYELPEAGVDIQKAWIDGDDTLGIPEGFATDLAVFKLNKPATQHGWLVVRGGDGLAVYLVRKVVGSNSHSAVYLNGRPVDLGSPDLDVNYTVLVGPAKTRGGDGEQTFSSISLEILDN